MPDAIAPTLLIGLGGIGSTVVENIYTQIPEELRSTVAVHAFDTNVNDIRDRRYLKGHITQTSRPMTVGDYLARSDRSVRKWFPDENRLLWRKTLTEGAGQIRTISRLGYRAAMEAGQMADLEKEISRIFIARGDEYTQAVRVVIASSLAGGTGAGMFLQTALFLRDLLQKHFSKSAVLIRGAFLLPDTLILGKILDQSEYDDVRTNAYACFKELNALTRYASSPSGTAIGKPIELEFKDGQTDESGQPSTTLNWNHLPFDFSFLYDFENSRGENLGDFKNYLNQVSTTVFLQLFSPLQKNHFSEEDNAVQSLIREGGMNRYCGAGASALIYPKTEIIEYCALRWAESSLDDEWLRLDEEFEQEKRDYANDLRAGVFRAKPELGERYVALLDQHALQQSGGPFFRQIWNSTRILDENGRELSIKADQFLTSVMEFSTDVLENDEDLTAAARACRVDEGKLKHKKHAKKVIDDMELALDLFQEKIFQSLPQHRMYILNTIFFQDSQHPQCLVGTEEYRLNRWLLKSPTPLHPVAVRYFLYQTLSLIERELSHLREDNQNMERQLKGYVTRYDLRDTEKEETADMRLRDALNENMLKRIFKNQFKEFTEEYLDASTLQYQQLQAFKKSKLHEMVLTILQETLLLFSQNWERYFAALKDVQIGLLAEIATRGMEHEGTTDPYRDYVLATKAAKEKFWEDIQSKAAFSDVLPDDICRQIYQGQYRRTCEEYQSGGTLQGTQKEKIDVMFRQDVLGWCRIQLLNNDALDLNVLQALAKESRMLGRDESLHSKERIRTLDLRTKAFVPIETDSSMVYWGVNPKILKSLTPQQTEDCFGSSSPGITHAAFSPYQIIRYRAVYGLQVENFPKFSSDPRDSGVYHKAYRSKIKAMQADPLSHITPHLDKRWHLPAYLPDLNPELAENEQKNTETSFLLGLISGSLYQVDTDLIWQWKYRNRIGESLPFLIEGEVVETFKDLFVALSYYPERVQEILLRNKDSHLDQEKFELSCRNLPGVKVESYSIFDAVFHLAAEFKNQQTYAATETLLVALLEEIYRYYVGFLGDNQARKAKEQAVHLVKTLISESKIYAQAKEENWPALDSWQGRINYFMNN